MGKEPDIHQMPMQPGDVNITYADISKAARILDYHPQTSFEQGISSFIQWYYEQKG
jgi:UDP-glucuronate 4-epimerase